MRRRRFIDETNFQNPRGAYPVKVRGARLFRKAPTPAEAILWQGLRRRQVAGFKFRRQHIIAGYIVDFYCTTLCLAIEVDGGVHDSRRDQDARRTRHLHQLGVRVLRIPNAHIFADLAGVIAKIASICDQIPPNDSPTSPRLRSTSPAARSASPIDRSDPPTVNS
jgi:very-short-patch-repair endonuclease